MKQSLFAHNLVNITIYPRLAKKEKLKDQCLSHSRNDTFLTMEIILVDVFQCVVDEVHAPQSLQIKRVWVVCSKQQQQKWTEMYCTLCWKLVFKPAFPMWKTSRKEDRSDADGYILGTVFPTSIFKYMSEYRWHNFRSLPGKFDGYSQVIRDAIKWLKNQYESLALDGKRLIPESRLRVPGSSESEWVTQPTKTTKTTSKVSVLDGTSSLLSHQARWVVGFISAGSLTQCSVSGSKDTRNIKD